MAQVAEPRFAAPRFLVQPRVGIRRRLMRRIGAPLADGNSRSDCRRRPRRRFLVARPEALLTRPRLEQRAVDREMLVREQPLAVGVDQHRVEERRRDVAVQQPIPILRERRRRPHRVVHAQPDEPAKQQVVIELLHQLPLAANRVERLQQQRAQQLLRRNRRPPELDIQRAEPRREPLQRPIGDAANRAQRMIRRHPLLERHVAEHRSRLLVGSTHQAAPFVSGSMVVRMARHVVLTFSAAC